MMPTYNTLTDIVYGIYALPDFAENGTCFAARTTGLYRSDDYGQTWRNLFQHLEVTAPVVTTCAALSPSFDEDKTLFAGVHGGVLRSFDGGSTWEMIPFRNQSTVTSLVISPRYSDTGALWAGTSEDGLYLLNEQGAVCRRWNYGLFDWRVLSLTISPDETLYAGTESGVYVSTNHGGAWQPTNFPSSASPVLSLAAASDNRVYAGTEAHGLYRSKDGGITWTVLDVPRNEPINQIVVSPYFFDDMGVAVVYPHKVHLYRRDFGWMCCYSQTDPENPPVTCAALPLGVERDAPLLIGTADGVVVNIRSITAIRVE